MNDYIVEVAVGVTLMIISSLVAKFKKQSWVIIACWGFAGLVGGICIGILVARYVIRPPDPCYEAKIAEPPGNRSKNNAAATKIPNKVKITWTLPSCVMTIQSYQKEGPKPVQEYKDVVSGTELYIGDPNSGPTEIKMWVEGNKEPSDSVWVWLEEAQKPEEHKKPSTQGNKVKPR